MLIYAILTGILALAFAAYLAYDVMKRSTGTKEMREVSDAIKEGSNAFMKRQYTTIGIISIVIAILIYATYYHLGKPAMGTAISVAFIIGAVCSGLSGIIGMFISVRSNIRTASAARKSTNEALKVAMRGGAVSGITIVALSLLGLSLVFHLYSTVVPVKEVPFLIVGYGFGASLVALFAQLGGGIYTKAADVGADLVGKVESGIPEDDPRNPAVIADLVGDNVGDCAGRGADLFESTAAENIGAMIIGVALYTQFGINGILFPLFIMAAGLIASIVGLFFVKMKNEKENPMKAINRGYYVTSILVIIFMYFITMRLLENVLFFYAGIVGVVTSIIIVLITIYYTEHNYRPVRSIAEASKTGHATNVISGLAVAFECVALPVIVLCGALILSFKLGTWTGIAHGGIYGTAVATMGMLATCAYILAMDTFGPISDNAGGIIEMSKAPAVIRKRTDRLDAVGNTTKALTKGYAIGSAALAAFLLFTAYMDEVANYTGIPLGAVDISKVPVFVGALLGATLVFLFSAFAIRAVGNTAFTIIEEVRRQFREIKGIMSGKAKPDYAACVDICAKSALKRMMAPGILVVFTTVVVGVLLKAEAVAAFIMVATIAGILLALMMNTGGGAWDNAKKYIEDGAHGGKGSDAHKAAVTGDTIGDPFKDTAGPSIHVLIKLLGTITLVLVPLFV